MHRKIAWERLLIIICMIVVLYKAHEYWLDQYVQAQIKEAVRDYDQVMEVKEKIKKMRHRLKNALDNAWKITNFKDDRQLLSRRLNMLAQELNQCICDLNKDVTATGGWCGVHFSKHHDTDKELAMGLAQMMTGQTVASFGEGPGIYRKLILNTNLVKHFDAYDGSPFIQNATKGQVQYLELTVPQYGLPAYDWIISLEVAEHIPPESETVFLENLVRHAKRGVVMSWATIGQGGIGHINTRSDEYVLKKMTGYCFYRSPELTVQLKQNATFWYLKRNLNVYVRRQECPINLTDA